MRKQVLPAPKTDSSQAAPNTAVWLPLGEIASVQLTSEDAQHPFESALDQSAQDGWRASAPGPQTIKIVFDWPQPLRRIRLEFREAHVQRSQEFAIFITSDSRSRHEIVRQQWNFSTGDSSREIEDYAVDVPGVSVFELEIDPGRHDREAIASLQFIALAG